MHANIHRICTHHLVVYQREISHGTIIPPSFPPSLTREPPHGGLGQHGEHSAHDAGTGAGGGADGTQHLLHKEQQVSLAGREREGKREERREQRDRAKGGREGGREGGRGRESVDEVSETVSELRRGWKQLLDPHQVDLNVVPHCQSRGVYLTALPALKYLGAKVESVNPDSHAPCSTHLINAALQCAVQVGESDQFHELIHHLGY